MERITEGAAVIENETAEVISRKDLPVFYNPVMKHNRDIGLLLLVSEQRPLQCCDLLAGSGIRSIRILKEIPEIVQNITINDYDAETFSRIKKNLATNELEFSEWDLMDFVQESKKQDGPGSKEHSDLPRVIAANIDGSQLLLSSNGYDYIEVDPFGSPNQFLDAACKRLARNGILALTFTDTSALAGSYPDACMRKYWGKPTEGHRIHEVGLRLLVRKVQLVAAQYDKALTPILVYNHDHYYRAYFRCTKGKQKCDELLAQHGTWSDEPEAGDMWLGPLCDAVTISRIKETLSSWTGPTEEKPVLDLHNWLDVLTRENSFTQPGHYYQLNELQQTLGSGIKKEQLLEILGAAASPVHYEGNAIKTEKTIEEIRCLVK